jgi:hypothetical protein
MNENLQMILGGIIIMVGFGAAIAYPRLQYSALRKMRGVWLVLSLVPLAVMLVVGVITALALSEGANLWPILLIFTRVGRVLTCASFRGCAAAWPRQDARATTLRCCQRNGV